MNIQNGFEINEQRGYKLYDIGFYPPGQKCFPTNRDFRSGRVIRLLAIQGEFTSTFSPVARQLLVFRTYDIYEKFS